ncbi:MAG: type II toxin-antitoxin system RelE/ParE family toxin [Niveispirillum sp.]|uniref:type II toxin-antitoxin system RelE/ParE family toxin n=1 Tax=Niveispirillum sp. TaxID=1917217 RepID=UPI004034FF92
MPPAASSDTFSPPATAGASFPKRGKARPDGTRELAVVHPYILVYDIVEDEVRILRVWHGAQDRG